MPPRGSLRWREFKDALPESAVEARRALYAVQLVHSRAIKVGNAHHLMSRLQALSATTREPLRLLFAIPGAEGLVREVLASLDAHRVRGPIEGGVELAPRTLFQPVPAVIQILDGWYRRLTASA